MFFKNFPRRLADLLRNVLLRQSDVGCLPIEFLQMIGVPFSLVYLFHLFSYLLLLNILEILFLHI
jgi:hypothetical protein